MNPNLVALRLTGPPLSPCLSCRKLLPNLAGRRHGCDPLYRYPWRIRCHGVLPWAYICQQFLLYSALMTLPSFFVLVLLVMQWDGTRKRGYGQRKSSSSTGAAPPLRFGLQSNGRHDDGRSHFHEQLRAHHAPCLRLSSSEPRSSMLRFLTLALHSAPAAFLPCSPRRYRHLLFTCRKNRCFEHRQPVL